jgi:hypothetical protein
MDKWLKDILPDKDPYQGRIQDFKLGGAHYKKMRRDVLCAKHQAQNYLLFHMMLGFKHLLMEIY